MRNRKTTVDVVRAWKDPAYRATLSTVELAQIPASPVGMSELDPNVLGNVIGAGTRTNILTIKTCAPIPTKNWACRPR